MSDITVEFDIGAEGDTALAGAGQGLYPYL